MESRFQQPGKTRPLNENQSADEKRLLSSLAKDLVTLQQQIEESRQLETYEFSLSDQYSEQFQKVHFNDCTLFQLLSLDLTSCNPLSQILQKNPQQSLESSQTLSWTPSITRKATSVKYAIECSSSAFRKQTSEARIDRVSRTTRKVCPQSALGSSSSAIQFQKSQQNISKVDPSNKLMNSSRGCKLFQKEFGKTRLQSYSLQKQNVKSENAFQGRDCENQENEMIRANHQKPSTEKMKMDENLLVTELSSPEYHRPQILFEDQHQMQVFQKTPRSLISAIESQKYLQTYRGNNSKGRKKIEKIQEENSSLSSLRKDCQNRQCGCRIGKVCRLISQQIDITVKSRQSDALTQDDSRVKTENSREVSKVRESERNRLSRNSEVESFEQFTIDLRDSLHQERSVDQRFEGTHRNGMLEQEFHSSNDLVMDGESSLIRPVAEAKSCQSAFPIDKDSIQLNAACSKFMPQYETVPEEEPWQCDELELEEELQLINHKISERQTLFKPQRLNRQSFKSQKQCNEDPSEKIALYEPYLFEDQSMEKTESDNSKLLSGKENLEPKVVKLTLSPIQKSRNESASFVIPSSISPVGCRIENTIEKSTPFSKRKSLSPKGIKTNCFQGYEKCSSQTKLYRSQKHVRVSHGNQDAPGKWNRCKKESKDFFERAGKSSMEIHETQPIWKPKKTRSRLLLSDQVEEFTSN